ncbi:tRNA lysidine(34) synthetase TilS [Virgibacillus sp. W0181]|uniref:tRNA lysidine(34) synthetase TilS n=1 Tax=Virgibacillus sp. W0181 TaxID=3391581 RepID=UPI003F453DAD
MRKDVLSFMEKHNILHKHSTVLIGVSGGPDSMALLHFYHSIQYDWKLRLIALSVDHQLRGEESRKDLEYVERTCAQWKIPFIKASVNVPVHKKENKLSTQVAARQLRYQIFEQHMADCKGDYLALGHHADDQVETMLMEWIRSASSNAVSGIPVSRPFQNGLLVRPFLGVTKNSILHYCKEKKIFPRTDPSNEDTVYTRNYIRKRVIPTLIDRNPNIHQTVQHLSETLQEDEKFLKNEAEKFVDQVIEFKNKERSATFQIKPFKSSPRPLQRRAFHLILNYLYNELPGKLSYIHEEIFFTLLETEESNRKLDFPHQLTIEKVYDQIFCYFPTQDRMSTSFKEEVHIPGDILLPDGLKFCAVYTDQPEEENKNTYVCSANAITLPLIVRTRRDGDRMRLRGLNGRKKLKDLFIDRKIPRNERDRQLLVTDSNGEILWAIGLQKANPKKKVENSPYVKLKVTKSEETWEEYHE